MALIAMFLVVYSVLFAQAPINPWVDMLPKSWKGSPTKIVKIKDIPDWAALYVTDVTNAWKRGDVLVLKRKDTFGNTTLTYYNCSNKDEILSMEFDKQGTQYHLGLRVYTHEGKPYYVGWNLIDGIQIGFNTLSGLFPKGVQAKARNTNR